MNPYTRVTLVPSIKTAAVYVTLMNHGAREDQLLSVSTAAATGAAIHESKDNNGVMEMREVLNLPLPPHATVALEPAATHIMLTGLVAPLKLGDTVKLTLTFAVAGQVEINVPVLAMTEKQPEEDHSQH
jgi:periplasmic copper chaperone A